MKKFANYFGIAGLGLVLLGLVFFSITNVLTLALKIMLIVGGVLMIAFIALKFSEIKSDLSSRSAKFGTNAVFTALFLLGILIILNILLTRWNFRTDTTAAKQFSLADQTKKVLKSLDKDIKVTGFFKDGEEVEAKELLTEYANISKRFTFEFVDPDKNPGLAKRHDIKAYGTLLIDYEGKIEKIQKAAEEDLTNAIIKVTREGVKKIYFVSGHGEKDLDNTENLGLSKAKQGLENENYVVEKKVLAELDSIPSECSVLILAGPKNDMFPQEYAMIEKYLKKGGKALFMLDPESAPGYGNFLSKYGFIVDNDIVVDASGIGQFFGTGPTFPIVSDYAQHKLTEDFGVMTFFPEARSIRKADNVPSDITFTEIAKTSPRSWGESNITAGTVSFDPDKDIKGPVTILAVAEKNAEKSAKQADQLNVGTGESKTRIAVFGDSDFAVNAYFNVQGNGNLFLNTVSWLAQEEDLISVRAKDPEDRRLTLTEKQSRIILYVGVLMLPILIFSAGIYVYVKRSK
jgi:ABC-type uncharacterized transport system involved in gliding motility auxiliary subunit